jgi:DNA-binding NarL/FixJ family response regulator
MFHSQLRGLSREALSGRSMNTFPRKQLASIRVVLAEASTLKCQLLDREFRRRRCGIEVASFANDSAQLLKAVAEFEPDVVICHTNLRDGIQSGLRVIRQLCSTHPEVHVILLLDTSHRDHVVEAFRYGAHGVFCGDESFDALCKCVEAVSRGQIWASNKEICFLLEALSQPSSTHAPATRSESALTRREEEVVRLVTEGLTNKDISVQLNLSEHTVRNYLYRIFEKVGISSRIELVLRSLNNAQHTKPGPISISRQADQPVRSKRQVE